jgi:hypothetical protein
MKRRGMKLHAGCRVKKTDAAVLIKSARQVPISLSYELEPSDFTDKAYAKKIMGDRETVDVVIDAMYDMGSPGSHFEPPSHPEIDQLVMEILVDGKRIDAEFEVLTGKCQDKLEALLLEKFYEYVDEAGDVDVDD